MQGTISLAPLLARIRDPFHSRFSDLTFACRSFPFVSPTCVHAVCFKENKDMLTLDDEAVDILRSVACLATRRCSFPPLVALAPWIPLGTRPTRVFCIPICI